MRYFIRVEVIEDDDVLTATEQRSLQDSSSYEMGSGLGCCIEKGTPRPTLVLAEAVTWVLEDKKASEAEVQLYEAAQAVIKEFMEMDGI